MQIGPVSYDASAQWLISAVLGSMVLCVALNLKWQDFVAVKKAPKAVLVGLFSQFLVLPASTLLLTLLLDLDPGIELGMILVAACPGGAISNFVTQLSRGNTALSISMTAVSSVLAVVMLPLNFVFWSGFNPHADELLKAIDVDSSALIFNLLTVLAMPLVLGLVLSHSFSGFARKLHRILNITSIIALLLFIVVAVNKNYAAFTSHFTQLFLIVLIHNAIAFLLGFSAARLGRLNMADTKATTIEVGMQNSSLAIAIVFSQFHGEPGMALISAFWGTWHIVSGLGIAGLFRQITPKTVLP